MRMKTIFAYGRLFWLCALTAGLTASGARAAEQPPQWWSDRSVLTTNMANDYAALNTGQLRHLAHMAWLELDTLPGGAGFTPAFTNAGNNYAAVNIGQLKEAARPFYDRLGLTNQYPWTAGASSNDYALANIGQAKFLFRFDPQQLGDFDQDGMQDSWEIENEFNPFDSSDAAGDADSDGLSNLDECVLTTPPRNPISEAPAATSASLPIYGPGAVGLLILTPDARH